MKIGPLHIGRHAADPTPAPTSEKGASGTVNMGGYLVQDEYNPDLRWPGSLHVYDRMRRSDGTVREALGHIFAPILNATWDIDPASDDPQDLEVAEFVRRAYFDWPHDPFDQTLRQTLGHLTFGFQVFETVEQIVEAELEWTDPNTDQPVVAPSRQFLTWRRWAYRRPDTIWKWNMADGELESILQRVWKDDGFYEITIPAEQLVVFVNEKEGDDFLGLSLLRTSYKAWWLKEITEKVMGVAMERHGTGILTAYVPEDARNDDAVMDRIEAMLKGMRAGEFPYAVFPGPKGPAPTGGTGGNGGFWFEIVTPNGALPDFTATLEYLRGEIKGSVLARFAELGHAATGARATADVQSQVWYDALHSVARYIAAVHRGPIRRLVDKNYTVERYPSLIARDIEARSLVDFAAAVSQLTSSGAITPDKSLREAVRAAADLPDEDEQEQTDPNETTPPPPPAPVEEDPTAPPTGGA